jgi:hypothetical protein
MLALEPVFERLAFESSTVRGQIAGILVGYQLGFV